MPPAAVGLTTRILQLGRFFLCLILASCVVEFIVWRLELAPHIIFHDDWYNGPTYLRDLPFLPKTEDSDTVNWRTDWARQLLIHPPLVSLFYFSWIRVFGASPVSIHIPALLAGVLTIGVWHRIIQKSLDRVSAHLFAVFMLSSAPMALYSVQAIHAVFESLFLGVSVLVFCAYTSRRTSPLVLCAVNVVSLAVFYHFAVWLCVQSTMLIRGGIRDRRRHDIQLGSVFLLLVTVVFIFSAKNRLDGTLMWSFWEQPTVVVLFDWCRELPTHVLLW